VIRFDKPDTERSIHVHQCPPPDFGALATALMEGRRPDVSYTPHDMAADAIGLLDALAIARAHAVGQRHDTHCDPIKRRGATRMSIDG
jgi:hypothetical protein